MLVTQRHPMFDRWLASLRDPVAKRRIHLRLRRMSRGNPGDVRFVGAGLWEIRIDSGPGYRVYYTKRGARLLILCGGDKSSQTEDIARARTLAGWGVREMREEETFGDFAPYDFVDYMHDESDVGGLLEVTLEDAGGEVDLIGDTLETLARARAKKIPSASCTVTPDDVVAAFAAEPIPNLVTFVKLVQGLGLRFTFSAI